METTVRLLKNATRFEVYLNRSISCAKHFWNPQYWLQISPPWFRLQLDTLSDKPPPFIQASLERWDERKRGDEREAVTRRSELPKQSGINRAMDLQRPVTKKKIQQSHLILACRVKGKISHKPLLLGNDEIQVLLEFVLISNRPCFVSNEKDKLSLLLFLFLSRENIYEKQSNIYIYIDV